MRRTMLYLPGNNPNMLTKGHLFGSDGIIRFSDEAVFRTVLSVEDPLGNGV